MVGIAAVEEQEDLILISSSGIMIRMATDEIRLCSRTSKGVRVMRVGEDTRVISMAVTAHEEDAEMAHPEDDGTADEGAADTEPEETEAPAETPADE